MKRILPCFLLFIAFVPVIQADFDFTITDTTDYEYGVIELNSQSLLITGSGVNIIEAWDFSFIEVRNTSPLGDSGGITDINLDDDSHLKVLGGEIAGIDFRDYSTGELHGGSINYIRSFQYSGIKHIALYCQPGWSWIEDGGNTIGITGLWADGGGFEIDFIDKDYLGYDPVWTNIDVIEVPEPVTLALLGMGSLLLCKRKT